VFYQGAEMKLIRVKIISADTCGGLLDGLEVPFRSPLYDYSGFDPLCLIGPNGSGKSQFLQVLAEIFQFILYICLDKQRYIEKVIKVKGIEGNQNLQFEIEYFIYSKNENSFIRVRILGHKKKTPILIIQRRDEEQCEWIDCELNDPQTCFLLPQKIVGYTSGDNETLSLPFLISRSCYASEVGKEAFTSVAEQQSIPDTGLMLIDYGTHLEVLVANLLLGDKSQLDSILETAGLQDLHSFRCIVQLNHSAAPKPKGIQLTQELKISIEKLKSCATCYEYDEKTKTYTFDYWVNDHTRAAFSHFWSSAFDLYSDFHKLAMLNDLAIPKKARDRLLRDIENCRFASRLPEPQDEHKVFRFERVSFHSKKSDQIVDYVSLSDGEHQLAQLLGIFCMLSSPNILFLLDEPESHFNPQWRVQFISKILNLPTHNGDRREKFPASQQDCLITTHAPFVPSNMQGDKVFIFSKNEDGKIEINNPDIQTFGATFNTIIERCFNVRPPISKLSRDKIQKLMKSEDSEEIKQGIRSLGDSVQKAFLADRFRELTNQNQE